jgi:hypothetical protein
MIGNRIGKILLEIYYKPVILLTILLLMIGNTHMKIDSASLMEPMLPAENDQILNNLAVA